MNHNLRIKGYPMVEKTQIDEITLTKSAADAFLELLKKRQLENHALRIFVSGGGCSGYQYGMSLEPEPKASDVSYEQYDVKVVVDETSFLYLRGATIDFVDNLMGSGFKIDNPNAISTCGCGNSFETREGGGHKHNCNC
jgi:iron-sulfur cluster assembly accessory protein